MTLHELIEKRHHKAREARQILNRVEAEGRDFNSDEKAQFYELDRQIDALDEDIRRLRRDARTAELDHDDGPHGPEFAGLEPRGGRSPLAELRGQSPTGLEQDSDVAVRAFTRYLRARLERELAPEEMRALSTATNVAGAYLVPTEFERTLVERATELGVMRQLATVITTDTGEPRQVPIASGTGVAFWLAENAAYAESDETFDQATLRAHKVGRLMRISEELLVDAAFDLVAYIASWYARNVGVTENAAYVAGDGVGKPRGFLLDAETGATAPAGNMTSLPADTVLDLYHSVKAPYRGQSSWLAHDQAIKAIRKLKTSDGQYIWQPGLQAGQPDMLLGRPLYTDPDMPVPAANAKSLAFGDFRQAYWIRDVRGVAIQRLDELFAANGQVGFRATHRTDGKLVNTEAVKVAANSAM